MLCSGSVSALQAVFSNSMYDYCKMGDMSDFQREQIVGACLAWASVNKQTLYSCIRAAFSNVMKAYTYHRKTSSADRNSG